MKWKTLIIDDEKIARERLKRLLTKFSDKIELIGQAADGEEALEMIKKLQPDLLFLDIQMPVLNGFEMLAKLDSPPLIIFTTAYDQFALKAFEENTIDYLLKPIEADRLSKAVQKLAGLPVRQIDAYQKQLQQLLASVQSKKIQRFPVKIGDKIIYLDYEDIYFFKASEKLVQLHTFDSDFILSESLIELEQKLPGNIFQRSHRSAIVNVHYIKEVYRWFSGRYRIVMKDKAKSELPLSRNLKHLFGF